MSMFENFLEDIDFIYPVLKVLNGSNAEIKQYIDEIESLRDKGRKFISENRYRIDKAEIETEKDPRFLDQDLLKSGAKYKFFSLIIPKEWGGSSVRTLPYAFFVEDLSSVSSGVATIFGAHSLGLLPVLFSPFSLSFSKFMQDVVESEKSYPLIYALGLTEPTGGSDVQQDHEVLKVAKITTRARRTKGGYILNGRKVFISNGSIANYITVAASPELGKIIWVLLDTSSKGFSVSRVENKMGQKPSHAAEIVFDEVFVPDEMILADSDIGYKISELTLSVSRAPVGAIATGIAKGLIKSAVENVGDFKEHQAYKIAEAYSKLYIARNLWIASCIFIDLAGPMKVQNNKIFKILLNISSNVPYGVSRKLGRLLGEKMKNKILDIFSENLSKVSIYSSIAKAYSSWIAYEICTSCMDLLGEKGIDKSKISERLWRDIKLTHIYETTNEVNNIMIFKNLFGKTGII